MRVLTQWNEAELTKAKNFTTDFFNKYFYECGFDNERLVYSDSGHFAILSICDFEVYLPRFRGSCYKGGQPRIVGFVIGLTPHDNDNGLARQDWGLCLEDNEGNLFFKTFYMPNINSDSSVCSDIKMSDNDYMWGYEVIEKYGDE